MYRRLPRFALSFAALFIAFAACAGEARADGIIFAGADACFPAGVGRGCGLDRAPHILSVQSSGSNSNAAGAVSRSATGDVRTGDWLRGSNTQTVALSEIGLTNASGLALYFDINEPNGANRTSVTLTSLVLTAYDSAGNSVFSASLVGAPLTLNQLGSGQGHSDYLFTLDAVAAARLQAAIDANPNLFIGLAASFANVQGGPESFFIGNTQAAPVPEPATMVLLGTGLAGLAAGARRKRRAAREGRDQS